MVIELTVSAAEAITEFVPAGFWSGKYLPTNVEEIWQELADLVGGMAVRGSSKHRNPYLIMPVGGQSLDLKNLAGKQIVFRWQIVLPPLAGRITIGLPKKADHGVDSEVDHL